MGIYFEANPHDTNQVILKTFRTQLTSVYVKLKNANTPEDMKEFEGQLSALIKEFWTHDYLKAPLSDISLRLRGLKSGGYNRQQLLATIQKVLEQTTVLISEEEDKSGIENLRRLLTKVAEHPEEVYYFLKRISS